MKWAFDATKPTHLPLPRAIGSYAVVRTTTTVQSDSRVIIIGAMRTADPNAGDDMRWTNLVGVQSISSAVAMNAVGNTGTFSMLSLATTAGLVQPGWENCQLTPAAVTVQIMFPSPIAQAGGIARIGRLHTLPNLENNTRTWDAFAEQFVSYNAPRLCAGGKLALRGVKMSAIPYNMNELSDFTPLQPLSDATFTWNASRAQEFAGFCPMVIVNDLTTLNGVEVDAGVLDLLITIEWRVRFDPSNPAQAAHVSHTPTAERVWHQAVRTVEATGHGVHDIVEDLADYGAEAVGDVASAVWND
jgi:hypothetical protein